MTRERIVSVPFRLLLISSVTVVRALGNDSLSCFLNIGCLPSSSFSHNGVRRAGCQNRHNRASDGDVYAEDIYNDEYSKGMSSEDSVPSPWLSRRSVVQTIIASSLINAAANNPQNAAAATIDTNKPDVLPDIRCLLDLPPPPPNRRTVRIYLCRHGQTEYNRLGKMQGSRIDPPLNPTGQQMAVRLGKALSCLDDKDAPNFATHSRLIRAKETAYIAAATIGKYGKTYGDGDDGVDSPVELVDTKDWMPITYTPSLNEVDFGPINEGKPVPQAKADMYAAYSAWAIGKIDTTPSGGGETGRQVILRACETLNRLPLIGGSGGGAVLAVSHGVYLRMVLAVAMEVSLLRASGFKQNNCCVNVLDVDLDERTTIGANSAIFGGGLSLAPKDFEVTIPRVDVVRVNEVRHLSDMLL